MGWFNHQLEIVGKVDFGFEKIPNFIPMGRKVYLPIHEWLIFYGKLVGKYTMDGMGRDHSWISSRFLTKMALLTIKTFGG